MGTTSIYRVHLEREIAVAHHLKRHKGKCRRPHGHNLKVVVDLESPRLIEEGSSTDMVVDFGDIKALIDSLDHTDLNDVFVEDEPTAENIATWIAHHLNTDYPHLTKVKVRVFEAEKQWAEVELNNKEY